MTVRILQGDMREKLAELADASVDAIVTDPPYGLKFMGKGWDHGVPGVEFWLALLRVAKPGAHLLAFGGTRTFHRLWCAVEDAGWEIRDTLMWLHGEGFPKSSNQHGDWEGWGTALKPAFEPIVLARKPLIGTVAENLEVHGVGALNIEASRVGSDDTRRLKAGGPNDFPHEDDRWAPKPTTVGSANGRWPANVLHDGSDQVLAAFPSTKSAGSARTADEGTHSGNRVDGWGNLGAPAMRFGDAGSAARFFWSPKASPQDRDDGLEGEKNEHPTVKPTELMQYLIRLVTPKEGVVLDPFMGSGSTGKACMREGMGFVGIELDPAYIAIAKRRIVGVAPLFAEVQ